MTTLPVAQWVLGEEEWEQADGTCALDYDARFFRRRKLTTTQGWSFVADFAQTVSLNEGDALKLDDGRIVGILAAPESLLEVRGESLPKLAWHIGNRHTPCQVEKDKLLIRNDPVISHMLTHLGARIEPMTAPFKPEGGAYGHGRTHGHEHGATAHAH